MRGMDLFDHVQVVLENRAFLNYSNQRVGEFQSCSIFTLFIMAGPSENGVFRQVQERPGEGQNG
jgi:hypothetical protein